MDLVSQLRAQGFDLAADVLVSNAVEALCSYFGRLPGSGLTARPARRIWRGEVYMWAKHPGKCCECGKRFQAGAQIAWNVETKAVRHLKRHSVSIAACSGK